LKNSNVAPLFDNVLQRMSPSVFINGFRCCGLCPFDPNAINYSELKLDSKEAVENDVPESSPVIKEMMFEYFEQNIDKEKMELFKRVFSGVTEESAVEHDNSLFQVWKKMKIDVETPNNSSSTSVETSSNSVETSQVETSSNFVETSTNSVETSQIEAPSNSVEIPRNSIETSSDNVDISRNSVSVTQSSLVSSTPQASTSGVVTRPSISSIKERYKPSRPVASPFKQAFFYQLPKKDKEMEEEKKKKRKRELFPSAVTSEEWQQYHKRKEEEKEEKERLKKERAVKRAMKTAEKAKKLKVKPKRQRKKKVPVTSSEDEGSSLDCQLLSGSSDPETFSDLEEAERENSVHNSSNRLVGLVDESNCGKEVEDSLNREVDLRPEDWVVVKYDLEEEKGERKWIGRIIDVEQSAYRITFLRPKRTKLHSGYIYQYLAKEDSDTVSKEQILYVLPPPERFQRCLKFIQHCDSL
jgi:hypothetical protein